MKNKEPIYQSVFIVFSSLILVGLGTVLHAQTISTFSPMMGPVGTPVTITGTGFDATPANNIVFFGATKASVTNATPTQLNVNVPAGATQQRITVAVNGHVAYSAAPFLVTFLGGADIAQNSFDSKIDFTTGSKPYGVAIGDLDLDGKPDMVVANAGSKTISVFRNVGSPGVASSSTFSSRVDFSTGSSDGEPTYVTIADLDVDGKPDIIAGNSNQANSNLSVFRNTISGPGPFTINSFAAKVYFAAPQDTKEVAVADFDGDGKPDLAIAGQGAVSVLRNTSTPGTIATNSFAAKIDFIPGNTPKNVAVSDLDGDGKPDMVVTNSFGSSVSVFRNKTTMGQIDANSFDPKLDFNSPNGPYGLALDDLNGDSKPEIIIVANNLVAVYANISAGALSISSFSGAVTFAVGSGANCVVVTDLNGDGKPDLTTANSANDNISVLQNTSSSGAIASDSFAPRFDFSAGSVPRIVALGDIDLDGKPDMVVTNDFGNTVSVLRNVIGETPVLPPGPPTITDFSPTSGPEGTTIMITGTNFSGTSSIVKLTNTLAPLTAGSSNSLTAVVPPNATSGQISVTVGTQTATSTSIFTVTSGLTVSLTSFSPLSGPVGTAVTINGTGFNATPSNNIIKFNGIPATVTSGGLTSLTVTVPFGASTGPISVTVAGQTIVSASAFTLSRMSRLGKFSVNAISGCAPLTVTLTNWSPGDCTPGQPCLVDYEGSGNPQQNQFTYVFTKAGTYKLSVLYQNTGTDDITINVNGPDVTVSPGASSICPGAFASLKAGGASTYSWSPTAGLSTSTGSDVVAKPSVTTDYTVVGTDISGCRKSAIVTVTVSSVCAVPGLSSGTTVDAYRMISIPLQLANNKIETVLSAYIERYKGYKPDKWRFIHYSNGNNVDFGPALTSIEAGKAYWLLSVDPLAINISNGTPLNVSATNPFKMPLDKGWTQIGNPFAFDISWSDVLIQNGAPSGVGKLYVYDPATTSFKESDNLKAWGGGFVNSTAATTLNIPVGVKAATGGRMSTDQGISINGTDELSWFVPLKLRQATVVNDLGGIGMREDALPGVDKYDENSLPRFVKYLEFNSYHPEYFQPRFMRDFVPTAESHSWNVNVESNILAGDVELSWDASELDKNRAQMMLFDPRKKILIDMKRVGSYVLSSDQNQKLTILYARDAKKLLTATEIVGQPFPNPFADQLTIPVIVPQDQAKVEISIYNVLGERILNLAMPDFLPGYNEIIWNREDQFGRPVSEGVYLVSVSDGISPASVFKVLAK